MPFQFLTLIKKFFTQPESEPEPPAAPPVISNPPLKNKSRHAAKRSRRSRRKNKK